MATSEVPTAPRSGKGGDEKGGPARSARVGRAVGLLAVVLAAATLTAWWQSRRSDEPPSEGPPTPEVAIPDTEALEEQVLAEVTPEDTAVAPPDPRSAAEVEKWCPKGQERDRRGRCRITTRLARPRPTEPPGLPVSFRSPDHLGRLAIPDAPDPFVLVEGETYYAFSTSAQYMRVPVAVIPAGDLQEHGDGTPGLTVAEGSAARVRIDALAEDPPWAVPGAGIWAPTAARFGERFVMFFAAKRPEPPDPPNAECIGRAVSERPEGPYVPDPEPVTCGLRGLHGALDPSIFVGAEGRAYLHMAFGGTSTPIWGMALTADGRPGGPPVPMLAMQHRWETWFLENPSMVSDGEAFVLAYSAGDWRLPTYSTGIARCRTPLGPCSSTDRGPWLSSRGDLTGPGGLSFFHDHEGRLMVAYHAYPAGKELPFGHRSTFIRRATVTPRPALL